MRKIALLKDFLRYLGSIIGEKVLLSASLVIAARVMGPGNYGIWAALSTVLLYGQWIHFGMGYALMREVPFYRGKKDFARAEKIKNTVFSAIMFFVAGGAVAFYLGLPFLKSRLEPRVTTALLFVPPVLCLAQLHEYAWRFLSALNDFKSVSKLKMIRSSVTAVLSVLLVFPFDFLGLILALGGGYLAALAYIYRHHPFHLRFSLDRREALSLLKIGFVVAMISACYNAFITIDRLLIFRFMGKVMLGYYSIASGIFDFSILMPHALGMIIYMHLAQRYGENESVAALKEPVFFVTRLLSYGAPGIILVAFVFLPPLVHLVLPQYVPGITVAQISIFGLFPLSVSIIYQYYLWVINKQNACLLFLSVFLVLKGVLTCVLIKTGAGLNGVAWGTVALYVLFSIGMLLYARSYFKETILDRIKFLLRMYSPFVYILAVFWCFHPKAHAPSVLILGALLPLLYLSLRLLRKTEYLDSPVLEKDRERSLSGEDPLTGAG